MSSPSLPVETLSREDLTALVERVFHPRADDTGVAFLVDLPDERVSDDPAWVKRRALAADWSAKLAGSDLGLPVYLYAYRNARTNNGDLPSSAWPHDAPHEVTDADALDPGTAVTFDEIFRTHTMLVAMTHFSTTAPLKLTAPRYDFRAATMPGFGAAMIPALRLDYGEINARCEHLKRLLDVATGADFVFDAEGRRCELHLDLRFRSAHASGGLLRESGKAGNLPSGETYIVPYEGENEPSRSRGILPVELDGEVVFYTIENNKATGVEPGASIAEREAALLVREPAYGNMAELGLGVLAAFGVKPIGEILLDEKLGPHIAFGRSDHFGGQVGASDFNHPEAVIHIDRVYLPETQPRVRLTHLDLRLDGGSRAVVRDGAYVDGLWTE